MKRFYDRLDAALTWVLIGLTAAMVFSITGEIVLNAVIQPAASSCLSFLDGGAAAQDDASLLRRCLEGVMSFVANASSPVNTASQTLLVWIGILGSALAFRYRAHLGVDALVRVYPPRIRLWLDYAATALVGIFSLAVLVVGGYLVCSRSFSMGSKMPGFEFMNRGWFYLVLVITGVLNLIYCVHHFLHPMPVGMKTEEKET
ncbi:MAG: TRAP transporter small permease subunit [Candidatus Omnitrophica bacterium]|nr:TRAP transporter small permease subunit [Candidatus Omnitrophota bacterium]